MNLHLDNIIGALGFFPTLLSLLRSKSPSAPLDPVILQSILLCIIAGDKHLILRTTQADVGTVAKIAAIVSTITCYRLSYLSGRSPFLLVSPIWSLSRVFFPISILSNPGCPSTRSLADNGGL